MSYLKLTRWLRTSYLGSSKADPRSNNVVNSNQTSLIRAIARARPTSKGGRVDHQNHDFLTVQWLLNSEPLFFLRWWAGDDHERLWRIQDHNLGKIQHRQRCESKARGGVLGCLSMISMYENVTASVDWYRGYRYRLLTVRLLVWFPSPPTLV